MCSEIVKKEKIVADGIVTINKIKQNIEKGKEERQMLKEMIEAKKMRIALLKPTLENLTLREAQLTMTLALVTAKLDDKSLRAKADIEQFKKIVQLYKTTCEKRRAEYEAMVPLAAKRHQAKIELQLVEVKEMVLAQKKEELIKLKRKKREIDERRMQVMLVEVLTIANERATMQHKLKAMDEEHAKLLEELQALKLQKERMVKQKEEEERARQRARQMMPPPRLDMSVLSTFCRSSTTEPPILQRESVIGTSTDSVDSDNQSINTAILERMCRDEDQLMDVCEEDDNELIMPDPLARSISMIYSNRGLQDRKSQEDIGGIEVLERSYSQLSLEKEDDNFASNNSPIDSPIKPPIEVQVIVQPPNAEDSPVHKSSSLLKAQSVQRKTEEIVDKSEGEPEEKKSKVDSIDEKKQQKKKSALENRDKQPRQLPTIKSVEKITRPVAFAAKPLVAEVTPTLSTLFSPTHYAPSCCPSIDDSDVEIDTNLDDTPALPNQYFSPPPALESGESFLSEISMFRSAPINADFNQQQQSTNTAFAGTGFMNMFQPQSKGFF
ncbi:paramyosin [Diachasma alloeum]|uniref:paramyosin n=1 Tax=Diachasma alloeum TaxID=454923 RepID=UPI0007384566|nr:paramyosin [Diachasma alloeum]